MSSCRHTIENTTILKQHILCALFALFMLHILIWLLLYRRTQKLHTWIGNISTISSPSWYHISFICSNSFIILWHKALEIICIYELKCWIQSTYQDCTQDMHCMLAVFTKDKMHETTEQSNYNLFLFADNLCL